MTDFHWTPAGYYKVMHVDLDQLRQAFENTLPNDASEARYIMQEILKYTGKIVENAHRCLDSRSPSTPVCYAL